MNESDPVEAYLDRPYHIVLVRDTWGDGTPGWFARVEELDGCMSQGVTPEEAVAGVRDAIAAWISVELEDGNAIPGPRPEPQSSGRFLVRTPRSLHEALVEEARREGVSLNQFVTAALSAAVEWRAPAARSGPASRSRRTA